MVIAVTAPARTIRCVFLGIGILQDCLYLNYLSINNPDVDKHFRLSAEKQFKKLPPNTAYLNSIHIDQSS